VRAPVKAFEIRIGKHGGDVIIFVPHCEPRETR
jgi:hypothetical protein